MAPPPQPPDKSKRQEITHQRQLQRTSLTPLALLIYTCFQLQVIIIIYLSVVGALLLYMAFLVLVDPLIRKPDPYTQPLHNEEDTEVRGQGNGGQGNSGLLFVSSSEGPALLLWEH